MSKADSWINSATDRIYSMMNEIIGKWGPRLTGTPSALACADHLKKEMDTFCDTTAAEDFKVHPRAFLDWIKILVGFYAIGVILWWFGLHLPAAILGSIGIIVIVLEFFLYQQPIDPFFPAKTGRNVYGTIEPQGEVQQQVIISGHHDSARIFNFFIYQPKLYPVRVMGGIGLITLFMLTSWISVILKATQIQAGIWNTIITWVLTIGSVLVVQLWFFASSKGTPGAGDNLAASAAAIEIGKHFAAQKVDGMGLKHTRLIIASWDAEEAGLRGARAYARKHQKELAHISTWNFNIDCPYFVDSLLFLTSDINGSVKLSEEMANTCSTISGDLGYKAAVKPIEFLTGGTDAAELAKKGVKATTMMGMPWGNSSRASVYHTPNDTPDAVEREAVKAVLAVGAAFTEKIDNETT